MHMYQNRGYLIADGAQEEVVLIGLGVETGGTESVAASYNARTGRILEAEEAVLVLVMPVEPVRRLQR